MSYIFCPSCKWAVVLFLFAEPLTEADHNKYKNGWRTTTEQCFRYQPDVSSSNGNKDVMLFLYHKLDW